MANLILFPRTVWTDLPQASSYLCANRNCAALTKCCLAPLAPEQHPQYGTIVRIDRHQPFPAIRASHICKDRGRLQAYEIPETINAQTLIERGSTVRCLDGKAYVNYVLHPKTGKTHQLRVLMNSLGLPILGDDFYPNIVQRSYDDFSQPLELVARELRFDDPVTGEPRTFVSKVPLG